MKLAQSGGMQLSFGSPQARAPLHDCLECAQNSTDHAAKQPAHSNKAR